MRSRGRSDEGQVAVMIVGFFIVIGLLAVVVINASSGFLQHQRLNNLADGAALAAADGIQEAAVYESGIDGLQDAPLESSAARRIVARYLAESVGPADVLSVVSTDQVRVKVVLRTDIHFPLVPPGWFVGSTVTSTSSALLRVGDGR